MKNKAKIKIMEVIDEMNATSMTADALLASILKSNQPVEVTVVDPPPPVPFSTIDQNAFDEMSVFADAIPMVDVD